MNKDQAQSSITTVTTIVIKIATQECDSLMVRENLDLVSRMG